ncbi:uncharacterized protein LOC62_02G001952 [Vanrija pseudolonga]|uniref:Ribosomal protein S21 n=1 Tax=Vanrija pseudolonga TaxID=143232 RepID=A0AAF1BI68_9TREE|nr:hypothetical protein LOC62_02G001952 [Vanrija pseudolonga]
MSFLFRSLAAARTASAPRLASAPVARFAPAQASGSVSRLLPLSLRFSSSSPSGSAPTPEPTIVFNTDAPSSLSSSPAADSGAPTPSEPRRSGLDIPLPDAGAIVPDVPNADAWWRASSLSAGRGFPGTRYSGRSIGMRSPAQYNTTYNALGSRLRRANVRKEFKLFEYHETGAKRRVRLGSERHRRRFKEMIRERVQQVQMLRARK